MKSIRGSLRSWALVCALAAGAAAAAESIEQNFARPPDSARPHTWWHWMNGNVTREGITADLEAMARVGVGGAQIFNAAEGIPPGPVAFNSPEWVGLVKHAAKEARRLGLELCLHNCAGWSSSGGPWNTPENGMKVVVTSERQVRGPSAFADALPQPPAKLGFYRDIAVLAFRTPEGERVRMRDAKPSVTLGEARLDGAKAADGSPATSVQLGLPKPKEPVFIQLAFAQPFTARMLTLTPGPGMQGCGGRVEASDDGLAFRPVETFSVGRGNEVRTFAFKPATARFFRVLFTSASTKTKRIAVAEVDLSAKVGVENLAGKIFLDRGGEFRAEAAAEVDAGAVVRGDEIVNLTAALGADARLAWAVPEGEWTILRLGYTANGRSNHPAPKEGTGLECDKLSKEAAQAHWDGHMAKVVAELGKYAGKADAGLNNVLIDSYEVGCQNWTSGFEAEFRRRSGYDLTPFLPTLTGRVVDSPEKTERFLWDFRRVIADLFAENYAGQFAEMAHRAGLQFSVEPYGNCPSDDLQYGSYGDIPMSEFWPGNDSNPGNAKLAASVAHVYGKKFVGAESFTASPEAGKWLKDPFSLKAQGDAVYCAGVNRIIYHRYAHQPWTGPTRYPGMTMGQWGTHFERTVTWWEQGKDWLAYQARCQYLLQEGRFVADVCFYSGEDAPNSLRGGGLPPGYDYDGCDTAALRLMSVKDGRIVLPSGMSYRVLALPPGKALSPAVLKTVKALADAGATIVGTKPEKAPGLSGHPASDAEVRRLADGLWGKGVREQPPADALAALGVQPDFACTNAQSRVMYIHRVIEGADVYFVSNQKPVADEATCTFRVSGRAPELWHPDTGKTEDAPLYAERDGRTSVPLRFDPAGSVFVVFRAPAPADHAVAVRRTAQAEAPAPVFELKLLKAEYGAFDDEADPECKDVTPQVKAALKAGSRRIRAGNELAGDPAPNVEKELKIDYLLNGEARSVRAGEHQAAEVPAGAEVVRALYGLIAEKPEPRSDRTVDVTAALAAQVKDGSLSARVDNALAGGKDPAFMTVKELRLEYLYKGVRKQARVRENAVLMLPAQNEQPVPLPAFALAARPGGALELQVWKPGAYEVETAAGRLLKAEAPALAKPVELAGPWELAFPPKWGAPAKVTLDKLISWTDHPDSGVKYFSGTAEYTTSFAWAAPLRKDERAVLDLGDLKNIAEVALNGKRLGLLWKPPFRLDATGALRAGKNTLSVKVTNLWPNRLIGDELLPEDREWDGIKLKAWPQWVLDGKPSPTGRFTFTTWHHWTRDDEPLPSGLFGPVQVRTVQTFELK